MAPDQDERSGEARRTVLALLGRRGAGSTICPSEAARAMAAEAGLADWRGEMPAVHAAIDLMVADGLVRLSWKGKPMPARDGPYRIALAAGDDGEGRRCRRRRAGPSR